MTILHANTDPDLLTRLRQTLSSAARADVAVGYFSCAARPGGRPTGPAEQKPFSNPGAWPLVRLTCPIDCSFATKKRR